MSFWSNGLTENKFDTPAIVTWMSEPAECTVVWKTLAIGLKNEFKLYRSTWGLGELGGVPKESGIIYNYINNHKRIIAQLMHIKSVYYIYANQEIQEIIFAESNFEEA